MIPCKNCQQDTTTKNGFVRNKQRYKCQACGYNFVLGDARHKRSTELKKALSIILYSLGKSSFGFLAKLFGVSRTTTYYWIRQAAAILMNQPSTPIFKNSNLMRCGISFNQKKKNLDY